MKILSVHLENFGSYETLDFDFRNQGLTLITGQTGSGKSTLMDAVPWILWGKTSKGGLADEVTSWPGNKVTQGSVLLETHFGTFNIVRIRGKGRNDLYFEKKTILHLTDKTWGNSLVARGKDLIDTQRLINETLVLNLDLYLSGSYFHEFSQTAQFFTTIAKNRRAICEQVVDLSLPTKLQDKLSAESKATRTEEDEININIKEISAAITSLKLMQAKELTRYDDWERSHKSEIAMLNKRISDFDITKNQSIRTMNGKCPTCGKPTDTYHKVETPVNPYKAALEMALQKTNPHTGAAKDYSEQIAENEYLLVQLNNKQRQALDTLANLELLQDLTSELRSVLISNTILQIEEDANNILSEYFDGELRILLDITIADKLDVSVTKDGNKCSYTQLSKGQRQLLKLSFGIAVMKAVSNNSGVNFTTLWFDEALDGMDDRFKMKAVKLLEELTTEYENVFFVEHSETVKAVINNRYQVTLMNGKSQICQL